MFYDIITKFLDFKKEVRKLLNQLSSRIESSSTYKLIEIEK